MNLVGVIRIENKINSLMSIIVTDKGLYEVEV